MSNERKLLFLDSKGLVPYQDESEEEFIHRGTIILLKYSQSFYISYIEKQIVNGYSNNDRISIIPDHPTEQYKTDFQKGIAIFNQKVKADFSWLPIFRFSNNPKSKEILIAFFGQFAINIGFIPIYFALSVDLIGDDYFYTGAHECFHALRSSFDWPKEDKTCLRSVFSHLGGLIYQSQHKKFNESLSGIKLVDVLFLLILFRIKEGYPNDSDQNLDKKAKAQFNILSEILYLYFGENNFYVLSRLSYDEMMENFLTKKILFQSPLDYLKKKSQTSLRHRIICLKLDL